MINSCFILFRKTWKWTHQLLVNSAVFALCWHVSSVRLLVRRQNLTVLGMTSSGKICLHEIQVWNTAKRQVITESEFHDIYSSSDEESDFESVFPMQLLLIQKVKVTKKTEKQTTKTTKIELQMSSKMPPRTVVCRRKIIVFTKQHNKRGVSSFYKLTHRHSMCYFCERIRRKCVVFILSSRHSTSTWEALLRSSLRCFVSFFNRSFTHWQRYILVAFRSFCL